ncbi:hypothetical protein [Paenibacillus qinlingensis]|uniref:phosphoribosyltransferase-like protein n=1 Tax=Paenibacillus qinlingensis TaxID=1837343 RepID=UPI001563096D|nr:hypothetical protein [Paenibacillus qinlingensis]NQX63550.1 hypothetical protein [Paenibacillus qinlingensis]
MTKEIPVEATEFVKTVFDKISTLIKYGVWGNVSIDRFKRWRKQFTTEEQLYYAAYLAYQLMFYNKRDVIALINHSFTESIREIALASINDSSYKQKDIWREIILQTKQKILVCPLATDSAASSSFMIARILRDQNIITETELCNNVQDMIYKLRRREVKAIIFVDDMIGSGTQAIEFYTNRTDLGEKYISIRDMIAEIKPDIPVYLTVAVAPHDAVLDVIDKTGLRVIAAEILTEKNDVQKESFWFPEDFTNGIEFLNDLETEKNIPSKGYREKSWAVTFEHGAPDVSCPFYYKEHSEWISLIRYRGEDV